MERQISPGRIDSRETLYLLIDHLSERLAELEQRVYRLEKAAAEKPENQTGQYVSCKQACAMLNMCPATLNLRRKEGKIKALRIGKAFMYSLNDLVKLGQPGRAF